MGVFSKFTLNSHFLDFESEKKMLSTIKVRFSWILSHSLSAFLVTISYQYILSTHGHAALLTDVSNKIRVVQMRIE